ncbi:5-demethoxyubiquinol-8 5-hydroxylase UbiM [Novosphingobium sp.]|uniref:5-demethoxyubiquinol-8 5-hydroxylase UbiM n=1 Tax=Novosphingobium sp. TaxID=1874826 RepID=UPI0035B26E32
MSKTIIVVGAGPAGLSLARGLAGSAHRVVLIEPQGREALADPLPDGREIALTLRSAEILRGLGVWQRIPQDEVYPLREARVKNGASPFALAIGPDKGDALGHMVSNHLIRRALFAAVAEQSNVELHCGRKVVSAKTCPRSVEVALDDGSLLRGDLLVAADSRFSDTRVMLGIDASVERFGHTMMVARIAHPKPHGGVATEWFDHGRTVALLPLAEGMSSLVVTVPDAEAKRIKAMPSLEIESLFAGYLGGQLGQIALVTRPTHYPLAMTYANRFSAPRAVLVGDTAVGMHPVTAHGFNFGLLGANRLAELIAKAPDPGAMRLLRRYALRHRLATLPLYQATLHIVRLFTDERRRARPVRSAVLRLGALPPVRQVMGMLLSGKRAA